MQEEAVADDFSEEDSDKLPEPEEKVAPVLGNWDIRGLAQAIRYQLVYSGVEFDDFYHYHVDDRE